MYRFVNVELFKSESLLSELQILAHCGNGGVDCFDKCVIYGFGNVGACKRSLASGLVASNLSEHVVLLNAAAVETSYGVDVLAVCSEHCFKRVFTESSVGGLAHYGEVAAAQLVFLAV